jgi:hypothetical protein
VIDAIVGRRLADDAEMPDRVGDDLHWLKRGRIIDAALPNSR